MLMNTQGQTSRSHAGNPTAELPEHWQIDSGASTLRFTLRHLVISEIRGQFLRWGGNLLLDRREPSRSTVEVWVDLASIETGDLERDAHVRSAEFLDVARHPRATFRSTAVELSDEQVVVRGPLDLHGVVHELELRIVPGPTSADGSGVARSKYAVNGAIDRQSFGLHWNQDLDVGGVVVGDRIELGAEVELLRLPDRGRAAAR
jgi:polyisoprenoid-binding protein YceI